MKQGATRLRRVPETAEEIAAMPARASADSAAATRAIPVNLMPLISAYRKRGRFMLRVENLPQHARFSAGQNNGDGSWSLALDELDELVYFVPKNASGADHTLSIRLVARDDTEAFTLALIDFPILGMGERGGERESAGFPKPVDPGPSQDLLRAELHDAQTRLAARDAELNQLRASAERMGVLLQQKLDQAVAEAEALWRREEPGRFAAEKTRLEEQFEQRLAERESRVQAIADIAREQQATQIRRLAQELGTAQETLAARDGELAASRAALERARAETESETTAARRSAEAKGAEALKAAEAEWQTKAGKALAEMTARRDQAEAAAAKAQAALTAADASGELQALRGELEKLRKAEADAAAAKIQTEAASSEALKAAEAAKAAEAEWAARAEAAEAALAAAQRSGSGHDAELAQLRADLERQRFQLEMDLLSAKVVLEEKAADALKEAEAQWQARADESIAALSTRAERAEAELADAQEAAKAASQPDAEREMGLNQLRRELEHQRVKAQEDMAAAHAAAGAKLVEMETMLAGVTMRAEAAEAALAKTPSSAEQEIAANQLRRELEHQRLKTQGEIAAAQARQGETMVALAAMTARAEAAEASLAKAPASSDKEVAALRRELEHQRAKIQSELAMANAALEARAAEASAAKAETARTVSEREADMTQLRAEFEQKGKAAESAITALRTAVEKESTEKLKAAEIRWQKEKAALQAEMIERTEAAEATLARARRLDASKADDDAYVHSLEREVKSLRATLADREISIVHDQAMQEHVRLGTVRDTPGSRWQPLMGPVGAKAEELTQEQKSRRRLFRDVAIVVAVAAAAVLLFPRLEAMLPDDLRWQIETLGGNYIPATTEAAQPAPQVATAVQPKAERPVMYVARAVNVRAEPSVSAPIAASLKRGAQVSVLEKRGNWDRVEIVTPSQPGVQQAAPAQQGWVYSSYLTDTDPGA